MNSTKAIPEVELKSLTVTERKPLEQTRRRKVQKIQVTRVKFKDYTLWLDLFHFDNSTFSPFPHEGFNRTLENPAGGKIQFLNY